VALADFSNPEKPYQLAPTAFKKMEKGAKAVFEIIGIP